MVSRASAQTTRGKALAFSWGVNATHTVKQNANGTATVSIVLNGHTVKSNVSAKKVAAGGKLSMLVAEVTVEKAAKSRMKGVVCTVGGWCQVDSIKEAIELAHILKTDGVVAAAWITVEF